MNGNANPDALTALVADDEALARRRIIDLLRGRDGVRVVGQAGSGTATLEAVRRLDPDVLFLDVQMPGLDGFEVLARLGAEERPLVVFSTAYDEHALAAFEVHAVDYLLKPFADERFEESLQRVQRAVRSDRMGDLQDRLRDLLAQVGEGPTVGQDGTSASSFLERFAVPAGERLLVIPALEVDRIEAAGDYVRLHVAADSHLVRGTMNALERRLDPQRFIRIHRSAIVQLDRVQALRTDRHGAYQAVLHDGTRLPIGRRFRDALLERFGSRW